MATELDFAPFAQILRTLMPRARGIYLYGPDGQLLWSSEGADYFDLRPIVEQLLADAAEPGRPERRGRLAMIDEVPSWSLLLRGELATVVAVLSILGRAVSRADEVSTFEAVERTLAPLLALVRRELAGRRRPAEPPRAPTDLVQLAGDSGRFELADTQELQWLLDVTHLEAPRDTGDPLEALLQAYAERSESDVVLLHVPDRHLERSVARVPVADAELELLRTTIVRHLFRVAQLQQKTLIVNKVREGGAGGLVPYRLLCVPLAKRGTVAGCVVAFNRASGRAFGPRDARMLERLAPRLHEIIDVQFDDGTGLPTRHAFEERVALHLAKAPDVPRAIVYCDVDRMHIVNDLFGFAAGDAIVRTIGELWRTRERPPGSFAARLDGDRFVAMLEDTTLARARAWALESRDAIARLAAPERCVGHRLAASFGVAAMDGGSSLEHSLIAARGACKAAKERGRNRVEVWSATDPSLVQRHEDLRVYRDLMDAFEKSRFRLYAQPIVPLWDPTRAPRYEILVRLLDDRQQPVAPDRFLAAANRYELLARLDDWVLGELLQQLGRRPWLLEQPVNFAVNVSAQTLASPDYLDRARAGLARAKLPAALLGFEIAESVAIGRLAEAERFVAKAAEIGCAVSLDDFGSGASSLAYLKSLPVAALKIDGLYVRDLLTNARSESIVRAILQIARQLEFETVAECVESAEASAHLATLGVTYGQGYAYAEPLPLAEVLDELARRAAPRLTDAVARPRDERPMH